MNTEFDDPSDALRVDGIAVAGELQMLFGVDLTPFLTRCGHCQHEDVFANVSVYVRAAGVVLRCRTCGGLLAQVVKTPARVIVSWESLAFAQPNTPIE